MKDEIIELALVAVGIVMFLGALGAGAGVAVAAVVWTLRLLGLS